MQVTVINKCARMLIRFYSFLCVFIWTMIFVLNAFIISSIDFRNVGFYRRLHQMQQYIFTFIIFVQHFFLSNESKFAFLRKMCPEECVHDVLISFVAQTIIYFFVISVWFVNFLVFWLFSMLFNAKRECFGRHNNTTDRIPTNKATIFSYFMSCCCCCCFIK